MGNSGGKMEISNTQKMNHLSQPTAAALKAANFPQPAPAPGQYWYEPDGELILLLRVRDEYSTFYRFIGYEVDIEEELFARLAYCPTAEEILRELGQEYYLSLFDGGFCCADCNADPEEELTEYESAAEACAASWLDKNKNKI